MIRYGIHLVLLTLFSLPVSGEEKAHEELTFSIQSGPNRERIWGIRFPKGEYRELSPEEELILLEERIFPRILTDAEAEKAPELWQVGFFHLDGIGTPRDLEKAETAFRRGMEIGRPEGLYLLGEYHHEKAIEKERSPDEQEDHLQRAETIYLEVLEAGFGSAIRSALPLAKAHLFGWYGLEEDPGRADRILESVEEALPESATAKLWRAKVFVHQERFEEAFDYAEEAQKRLRKNPHLTDDLKRDLKMAGAIKITAAVLGGEISRIDPEEFLETSKAALGITGRGAWFVPLLLLIILLLLARFTVSSWKKGEHPGLRLSITWLSVAVLAAGIGFNISLPGMNNAFGHWIGAILVTLVCLLLLALGGWERLFGTGTFFRSAKQVGLGIAIVVGGIAGLQIIAMGYSQVFEAIFDRPLGKQLASLFLESETVPQLLFTLFIVGIAIPFYEELFFRGFLYDSLEKKWNTRVALIASSVIFAIVHGITFFLPLLFLSFVLGWLRMKNGNLRMCFILHAANNSSAVLIGHFSGG